MFSLPAELNAFLEKMKPVLRLCEKPPSSGETALEQDREEAIIRNLRPPESVPAAPATINAASFSQETTAAAVPASVAVLIAPPPTASAAGWQDLLNTEAPPAALPPPSLVPKSELFTAATGEAARRIRRGSSLDTVAQQGEMATMMMLASGHIKTDSQLPGKSYNLAGKGDGG
jgi:hypothetical protein